MAKKKVTINVKTRRKAKSKSRRSEAKEMTLLGQALRGLGGLAGTTVGGAFGNPMVGSAVGTSLGATISKWLGSGDYTVGSNTLVQRVGNGSPAIPMMHNGGQSIVVRHKEYLGEIQGSIGFAVQHVYDINPGVTYTFPWLSDIARNFQEYRIKGMVFHYVPTSGSAINGTNPAIGSVMIQTSYRATDNQPSSKVEMMNEYWAAESAPNEAFCHPIECDPKENPFNVQYVRSGVLPTTENQLMYDLGRTFVATSGQQANGSVLGDLWVSYEVELKKPQVTSSVASVPTNFQLSVQPTISTTAWFGTSTTQQRTGGTILCTALNNTLTFPKGAAGLYLIVVKITATGLFTAGNLSGAAVFTNSAEARPYPLTYGVNDGYYRSVFVGGAGATETNLFYMTGILILDPQVSATVTFPNAAWTGTPTSCDLVVTTYIA